MRNTTLLFMTIGVALAFESAAQAQYHRFAVSKMSKSRDSRPVDMSREARREREREREAEAKRAREREARRARRELRQERRQQALLQVAALRQKSVMPTSQELLSLCESIYTFKKDRKRCLRVGVELGHTALSVIGSCSMRSFTSSQFQCMDAAVVYNRRPRVQQARVQQTCAQLFSNRSDQRDCHRRALYFGTHASAVFQGCSKERDRVSRRRCINEASSWPIPSQFAGAKAVCDASFLFKEDRRKCLAVARTLRSEPTQAIRACARKHKPASERLKCISNTR